MKIKPVLTGFGLLIGNLGFVEKSFFDTLLFFTQYWDYKPTNAYHADIPGVYTSETNLAFIQKTKIHIKCNVIDASVIHGFRQPILFGFLLIKPLVIRFFANLKRFFNKKQTNLF